MNQSPFKAILFDKDGVLVDFQATYGGATREIITRLSNGDPGLINRLADDVGICLSDNQIDPQSPLVAGYARDICAVWANVLGVVNDRAFQVEIDLMFKELTATDAVLIGGVGGVLQTLKPDYQLGVATNDTEECARAQLGNAGLLRHLDFLAGYNSGHGAKPGTGMAEAYLRHTQLMPNETVMVGDSIHDMVFARDAGMVAIGISTGPLPGEELIPHADHVIDSLDELPMLLVQSLQ